MLFVGVDVSKAKLDAALYLDPQRERFRSKLVANTAKGFATLLEWASRQGGCQPGELHLVLEATGVYHEAAALAFHGAGATVSVVNPARVKDFARSLSLKSKTDALDRVVLARYGYERKPPAWVPPPIEVLELQSLIRRLDAIETDLRRTLNRREKAQLSTTAEAVMRSLDKQLQFLEHHKRELERCIDDHIDRHPRLREDNELLHTIPCVADKTARRMIALFNAHPFRQAAQSAAYLGLDVSEHSSGSSVHKRPRLSKNGPAHTRGALYMPALSATCHNPDVAALYQRLLARGKPKKLCLAAAMRKLVHICFGVWKTRTPYRPQIA